MNDADADTDAADRVVVSYPADLGDWSREQLEADRFRTYLRRTLGDLSEGEVFTEFVDVGCCGNSPDIPLRVESFEGPPRAGEGTEIEFTTREAAVESGWEVQSAAGPE